VAQAFTVELFDGAAEAIDRAVLPVAQARMDRPDADLIRREFAHAARLLRHACRRAKLVLDPGQAEAARIRQELDQDMWAIIAEYRQLWLARNRPGGLDDSAGRLERARADYSKEF
jgi:hypothetical protein